MSSIPQAHPQIKQSSSKIEVLDIRTATHGNVKAYARIKVGALVISGVKVIQQPGQRAWVRLPDQQHQQTGKWYPIVSCLSPTLEAAISDAVLDAWRNAAVLGLGRGRQ